MNNLRRQIVLNTLTDWGALLIRAVIALIMVPFLLNHLGKEGYGLICLLGVIVSMTAVADLGLRSALGRELSELVARKDSRAFNELCSTALMLYMGIASVLAVVGWVLAPWFVALFKVSDLLRTDAILMIRFYGTVSIILSFITPVFSAGLSSYYRFDVVNSVQVVGGIVSSLLLFVVLSSVDNALYGWVGVMLSFQIIMLLLMYILFKRFCEGAHIGIELVKPVRLKPLFQLGGYMYALQMTQTLSERSDPVVISYFFGPTGVALYQPGARLSAMIRPVVLSLANQMYPLTTRQHVNNQQEKMQRILLLGTKYTLLLGSLFSAGMLVFAEPFCCLWLQNSLGTDYLIAAKVMVGWALVDMMTYAAGTQWSVLLGMKNLNFLIWTQLPTAILNVLVSIYLVGFTSLGIPGVLVATILIGLIRRPILMWYTAKVCGLDIGDYFNQAYLRPVCCFATTLFGAILVRFLIDIDSYFMFGVSGCFVAAIWGLSCWFFGLALQEKEQVLAVIMKQYNRAGSA